MHSSGSPPPDCTHPEDSNHVLFLFVLFLKPSTETDALQILVNWLVITTGNFELLPHLNKYSFILQGELSWNGVIILDSPGKNYI